MNNIFFKSGFITESKPKCDVVETKRSKEEIHAEEKNMNNYERIYNVLTEAEGDKPGTKDPFGDFWRQHTRAGGARSPSGSKESKKTKAVRLKRQARSRDRAEAQQSSDEFSTGTVSQQRGK